jgi:hypothetical protein
MSVYVKNGTPIQEPPLCETCQRAMVAKGYRASEQIIVCQATDPDTRVLFAVAECSRYLPLARLQMYQMEDMAWSIVPRGPKRQAGFVSPENETAETGEIEITLDEVTETEPVK